MRARHLLDRLDGAPVALPRRLDAASEHWWRLPPRARTALTLLLLFSLLAVAGGGVVRSPWGPSVEVAVAARDLPAGHHIAPDDLRLERRPARLVPSTALPADAEGTLVSPLARGSVPTSSHLGVGGVGALLDADHRAAVALPAELLVETSPGAHLDLVAADGQGGARVVATGARILARDGDHVWVEVGRDDAAAVAAAGHARSLASVVRRPP